MSEPLRFTNSGTCTVSARAVRTGYTTWNATNHRVTVAKGTIAGVTWNPGSTYSRVSTPTLPEVSGALGSDAKTYAVTDAGTTGCSFGSGNDIRKLTFTATGTCKVRATVARTGYNNWQSAEISLTVTAAPPVGITWSGYANSNTAEYGSAAPALQAPTLDPTTATAGYASTGAGCSASSAGVLTINAPGSCVVTLTATPANNDNVAGTQQVTVTVNKGSQTITSTNAYGSNGEVRIGRRTNIVTAPHRGRDLSGVPIRHHQRLPGELGHDGTDGGIGRRFVL